MTNYEGIEGDMKLEKYECFVEKIYENIAYITIRKDDREFYVDWDAEDLKKHGIKERRRFYLYLDENKDSEIILEAIPDIEITEERQREIERETEEMIGDFDPQDDY